MAAKILSSSSSSYQQNHYKPGSSIYPLEAAESGASRLAGFRRPANKPTSAGTGSTIVGGGGGGADDEIEPPMSQAKRYCIVELNKKELENETENCSLEANCTADQFGRAATKFDFA